MSTCKILHDKIQIIYSYEICFEILGMQFVLSICRCHLLRLT